MDEETKLRIENIVKMAVLFGIIIGIAVLSVVTGWTRFKP